MGKIHVELGRQGLLHVENEIPATSFIRLFGPLANSSCESLDRKHAEVGTNFTLTTDSCDNTKIHKSHVELIKLHKSHVEPVKMHKSHVQP